MRLTEDTLVHITAIRVSLRSENKRVDTAYEAALRNEKLDQSAIDTVEGSLDSDLEDAA